MKIFKINVVLTGLNYEKKEKKLFHILLRKLFNFLIKNSFF